MHEVARQVDPAVRVAYVDNDPIVHVHANALLAGQGNTSIVLADLRDPAAILTHPEVRGLVDFRQPTAVLLIAIVHFLPFTDRDLPERWRDLLLHVAYMSAASAADELPVPASQEKTSTRRRWEGHRLRRSAFGGDVADVADIPNVEG